MESHHSSVSFSARNECQVIIIIILCVFCMRVAWKSILLAGTKLAITSRPRWIQPEMLSHIVNCYGRQAVIYTYISTIKIASRSAWWTGWLQLNLVPASMEDMMRGCVSVSVNFLILLPKWQTANANRSAWKSKLFSISVGIYRDFMRHVMPPRSKHGLSACSSCSYIFIFAAANNKISFWWNVIVFSMFRSLE